MEIARKWGGFCLKGLLSGLLIWFVLSRIDWREALAQALAVKIPLLLVCVLLILVQVMVASQRWRTIIKVLGNELPFFKTVQLYYIGVFFNNFLPSSLGVDLSRMWMVRQTGLSPRAAINSVVIDRVITLLSLVFFVAALEPLLKLRIGPNPAFVVFRVIALAGLVGVVLQAFLFQIPERWERFRIIKGIAGVREDFCGLLFRPVPLSLAAFLSVLGYAIIALEFFTLARGIGITASLLDFIVLIPPVVLISGLPISIAGWGLRESIMMVGFAFIGVPREASVALSLLFGLVTILTTLPGGLLWLLEGRRRNPPFPVTGTDKPRPVSETG